MNIESDMAGYYARRASEYERIYQKPERQDELAALRGFVARSFVGEHVLEICCGTGYWTQFLAENSASVTAVDINEEVLEIARAKPLLHQKVTFQQADVYSLPAFPRKFDSGFAGFWWSHIPKPRLPEFLAGLHFALKGEARVTFLDNVYVEGSSTPISRMDADGNSYQQRKLDDGSTHEVLKNFPDEQELRKAVATFATDVQINFDKYYWSMTYSLKSARR